MYATQLKVLLIVPLLATFFLLVSPSPPASASTQPPTDWSFYVETSNYSGTMYTLGCNQGTYDGEVGHNSFVILDFGALVTDSGDQNLPGSSTVLTQTQIWYDATYFAAGYQNCSNGHTVLYLAIGANNDNSGLDYARGVAFADTVNSIAGWNLTYESHVGTYGAMDIESWGNSALTSTQSYNWYDGYSSVSGPGYVDFGSADGCPEAGIGPGCSYGWNQGDYYNFSWHEPLALSTPEIYYEANAEEWYWIADYGSWENGWIQPFGPLDTTGEPGSNTAAQAWNDLQWFFCPAGGCNYMDYSLEMHWTSAT